MFFIVKGRLLLRFVLDSREFVELNEFSFYSYIRGVVGLVELHKADLLPGK